MEQIIETLRKIVSKSGVKITDFNPTEVTKLAAELIGLGFCHSDENSLATVMGLFEHPTLKNIPIEKWISNEALPWSLQDNSLTLVIQDPYKTSFCKELSFSIGLQTSLLLMESEEFQELIQKVGKKESASTIQNMVKDSTSTSTSSTIEISNLESQIKPEDVSAPLVIRLVDQIFSDALDQRASDIHLTPQGNGIDVKLRIDGKLSSLMIVPQHLKSPVIARIKLLCGMDISEKRKPQDGRLRLKTKTSPVDLRVSTVPSIHGETAVIRILASNISKLSIDMLGMNERTSRKFLRYLRGTSKVVLVAGPTGSGKTSTLYSGLSFLADGSRNLITIEDPVEYRIDGITQMQVNAKTEFSFAQGLKSALRQDPDVIMVGEIRDLDTAHISMQAAQTGHLVLSTIHTNNAEGAITRLLDLGVPNYLIASSVSAVVAQRLLRKKCQDCLAHQNHCKTCSGEGYHGRIAVFSFLDIDSEISEAIRNNRGEFEITRLAKLNGFNTLWDEAETLINDGITTLEEAEKVLGPKPENQTPVVKNLEIPNNFGRKKLLLVEDDDTTRSILAMLFEENFFEVIEASNGVDGLEKAHAYAPNIIVSDLMMPRMSGLEMLKKLRSDKRISDIPVLMLTAAAQEDNELRLLENGADDFVGKSNDSKIMLARVERLLSRG